MQHQIMSSCGSAATLQRKAQENHREHCAKYSKSIMIAQILRMIAIYIASNPCKGGGSWSPLRSTLSDEDMPRTAEICTIEKCHNFMIPKTVIVRCSSKRDRLLTSV